MSTTVYLTPADLCQRLSIKRKTLYAWVQKGTIPCIRLGRLLRFDEAAVDKWILARSRSVLPQEGGASK